MEGLEGCLLPANIFGKRFATKKIDFHFSQPQYIKFNDGSGFTFQLLLKKENILSPFGMVLFFSDKVHTILWVP